QVNAEGGGIYNTGVNVTVTSSTISSNTAGKGGGIANYQHMAVSNSTITENLTVGDGGGIWVIVGSLSLTHSTVSPNSAANGGGIWDSGSSIPIVQMYNTVVAGNSADKGPDMKGGVASLGHNLFGSSYYLWGYAPTDLLDVDPLLG